MKRAHARTRRTLLPFLPLLLIAAPTPLVGQDYVDQVWRQLQVESDYVSDDDYLLQNYIIGRLNSGRTDSWTWTFDQGTEYAITGACDEDCSDLDILVEDTAGNVLVRDEDTDDIPVVFFRPARTGRYTVNVKMYRCSEEPCYFGFGLFYR